MGEIFGWRRPQRPLEFTGERWTSAAGGEVECEHLHRYLLARDFCRDRDVLDIACGEGYGAALLAQVSRRVVGIDIDASTIIHAAAEYLRSNLSFVAGDTRQIPLATESVDVVVSFETIEHFAEQEAFLAEIRRVLRPAGLLLISTPDCDVYSPAGKPANQHHVREMSREEFVSVLSRQFRHVSVLAQRTLLGSAIAPRMEGEARAPTVTYERRDQVYFERSAGLPRGMYLIACASDQPLAEPVGVSLYIHSAEIDLLQNQTEAAAAAQLKAAEGELTAARAEAREAQAELAAARAQRDALTSRLGGAEAALLAADRNAAEARQQRASVEAAHARERGRWEAQLADAVRTREEAERACASFEQEIATRRAELATFLSSTTWRSTYALRLIGTKLPQPMRRQLRNAARFAWRASRLRRRTEPDRQHLSTPGGSSPAELAPPAIPQSDIVFVSGFPDTPSEAYRVLNPLSVLKEFRRVEGIRTGDIGLHAENLRQASIIVLFRVPWSAELADIVKHARANGCLIVYDIDDYVFEPNIAKPNIIDGMRFLQKSDVDAYHHGVRAYRQALEQADYCTVTTEFLAQKVRDLGGTAYVLRNSVSPAMLGRYDAALRQRKERRSDGKLRIGYAAGTLTHQRDFAQVTGVLAKLLRERDRLVLTVVGHLDIAEFPELAGLSDRIEERPPVAHDELPLELMRFDINIAPLEVGNPFCEAKSELKFFNAALVEVPTVASATEPFRAAIRHGHSGFVAAGEAEWSDALVRLVDDERLRMRVGKLARSEALRQFGPGSMRLEVKRVYEELWQRRPHVFPPRHAGYDHFLYAVNYPAAPLRSAAPPPARSGGRRAGLDLHWFVPAFSVGWGGMTNALRIVQQLERFGHRNTLWIHNAPPSLPNGATVSQHYGDMIAEHFPPVAAKVYPLPADLDQIRGDAVIATDHFSAYPARAVSNVKRRFYFLQDNEPAFHPAGYAGLFAEATYRFGFDALSNGEWLHALAQRYGMWSAKWEQAADPEHYFTIGTEHRLPGHIAFYARQETPRRAVELGYLAFELLARDGIDFHVDLFGGERAPSALPYAFTHHGILSAAGLGELYRRAAVGMVFSATNYSIIPREMMACGLPVIELNSESSRASFPNGVAELADPAPESVAAHLKTLLLDDVRRRQLAQRALEFMVDFSWQRSARDIEAAMLLRLGETDAARSRREIAEHVAGK